MARNIIRYTFLTIPQKLQCELMITVDARSPEYSTSYEGTESTNLRLFPTVIISITRKAETDENGNRVRAPWNPNDSVSLTTWNVPIMLNELKGIEKDMTIPNLYTYHGERLELNDEVAEKVRRVFMVGQSMIELSPVVIDQVDDNKVEGIKMKFNNEQSTVLLTLNELTAVVYGLSSLNIDVMSLQLYTTFLREKAVHIPRPIMDKPVVDIQPKKNPFADLQ